MPSHYGHEAVRDPWGISAKTHAYWRSFIKDGNVRLEKCDSRLLAESADEACELVEAVHALNADGIDAEFVEGDPLGRGYCAAIRQPWDAAVQPCELARAVLAASGAELINNNELYDIQPAKGGGVTVLTRRCRMVGRSTPAAIVTMASCFIGIRSLAVCSSGAVANRTRHLSMTPPMIA